MNGVLEEANGVMDEQFGNTCQKIDVCGSKSDEDNSEIAEVLKEFDHMQVQQRQMIFNLEDSTTVIKSS